MTRLLSELEVCRILNISIRTLRRRRANGSAPPFIKPGMSVQYPEDQLDEWIKQNAVQRMSDLRQVKGQHK